MNSSLLLALVLRSVIVDARTTCPDAPAIQDRLTSLVPGHPQSGAGEPVVTVTGDRASLFVTVLNPDRSVFETRALPLPMASCDVAAENVAVVIATMLAEFRPAWVASFSPPPPAAPPVALRSLAFELGPLWASQQAQVAWRLALDAAVARRGSPWSLGASAFFEAGQTFDVAGGQAQVRQGGLVLEAAGEARRGAWSVSARLQGGAALLGVSGRGFLDDHTSSSLNPVVGADTALRLALRRLGIAVGPGVEYWPRAQELRVGMSPSSRALPVLAVSLRLAVGYFNAR